MTIRLFSLQIKVDFIIAVVAVVAQVSSEAHGPFVEFTVTFRIMQNVYK